MNRRMTRVNELLRREIGLALYRLLNQDGIDLANITVTHVVTSSDLRTARVLVSVRGDAKKANSAMAALRERRGHIQKLISKNVVLKYTPRLTFGLDTSLQEGDHVLDILRNIDNTEQEYDGADES
jgi:ribosome-binding factor A